jgi:hypothetical protein
VTAPKLADILEGIPPSDFAAALRVDGVRARLEAAGVAPGEIDAALDPGAQTTRAALPDAAVAARDTRQRASADAAATRAALRARGLHTPADVARAPDTTPQDLMATFKSRNDLVQLRRAVAPDVFASVLDRLPHDFLERMR